MSLFKLFSAAKVALRECNPSLTASTRMPKPMFQAPTRQMFGLVPPNQYENNCLPKKFQLGPALTEYWETIPLFICVVIDIFFVIGYMGLYVGFSHKIDTQFSKHNWNCIARNMDMRNPEIHKLVVHYQRYEPWPELQNVLDKMKQAEHRMQSRLDSCGHP